ncbi:MAG: matrixin family metalloprotease [Archangium sp.]|nr:matrixin family metalloprotease [Archangium sp.]
MHPRLPALLCLTLSLPCAAWDVRTDSEGDLVRWTKPLEMVLDARVGSQLHEARAEQAIRAAFQNLDEATPYLDVSVRVADEAKPIGYVLGSDNQNSVLALEDWPYSEDALAVTLVTLNARTNELLDADVAFNVESHRFRVLPDAVKDERSFDDVQNTITHELGHVLGLMHNDDADDLVMYPSAPPGELIKRTLKADDRDGLLSLYGTEPEPKLTPPLGCSSTATSPGWVVVVLVLLLAVRSRSTRLALCRSTSLGVSGVVFLLASPALAAEPTPPAVGRAQTVALVQVSARHSLPHPRHPGLILTELSLTALECLKGPCGELSTVVVAGGRLGELEQIVMHEPVPAEGQRILVTRTAGRVRVLWVEPDSQARIIKELRSGVGLPATQGTGLPPRPTPQVPAIRP